MANVNYKIDERLLSSFINFYGEENQNYIIKLFSNPQIIWYDNKPYFEGEDIHNHIITNIPNEKLNKYLSARKKSAFLNSCFIDEFNLLVLPQNGDLTQISHEVNHMVGSHILSLEPLKIINGISVMLEKNSGVHEINGFLNEAINQMMITEILNSINVPVAPSWQEKIFPLVEYFYITFKEEIKKIYIDGNLYEFINNVGIDNFEELSQLIFMKVFRIRNSIRKGEEPQIRKEDINKIEEIVNKMKTNYRQKESLGNEK
ncbi:MAG: hypothetical protein IJY25_00610 [Bacilli bacterium]|nr:hypothetical protein [Bacilli bacterium]